MITLITPRFSVKTCSFFSWAVNMADIRMADIREINNWEYHKILDI